MILFHRIPLFAITKIGSNKFNEGKSLGEEKALENFYKKILIIMESVNCKTVSV